MVSWFSTNYRLLGFCSLAESRHYDTSLGRTVNSRGDGGTRGAPSLTRLQAHKHRKVAVIGQELMETPISSHSGMCPLKPYQPPTCKPDSGLIALPWHVHAGLGAECGQTRRRGTENPSSLYKPQWLSKRMLLFSFSLSF